jgi:predicted MarR family transcription regulator
VTAILRSPYNANQASYDLRRLKLKGLIERQPRTNTYRLTQDGRRFALFYTKVHDRVPLPLMAADQPPVPPDLREHLAAIDRHVDAYTELARTGG